jgi:flagellar hook-length control protein FliK
VRVDYYRQTPIKSNSINQLKQKPEQKSEVNKMFQQILSREQAVLTATAENALNNNPLSGEITGDSPIVTNAQDDAGFLQHEGFDGELMNLLINSLPMEANENLISDSSLLHKLTEDFEPSVREEFVLALISLLQSEPAISFTQFNREIVMTLKERLESILDSGLLMEEQSGESFIRELVMKITNKSGEWQLAKENGKQDYGTQDLNNKPSSFNKLFAEPMKNSLFTQSPIDISGSLTAGKLQSAAGKMEIHNTILNSHLISVPFQNEKIPVIALNETDPKQIANQQFTQQLLEIIHGSKFMRLGNGQSQLIVRLHPEHLGSLTIKLVQANGELTAKIIASTVSAKELIEANIQQIRHVIPAQNIMVEKFDVFAQQPSDFVFREHQQESRGQQHSEQKQHEKREHDNESDFKDTFAAEILNFKA